MVRAMLALGELQSDAADGLAIALCHAHSRMARAPAAARRGRRGRRGAPTTSAAAALRALAPRRRSRGRGSQAVIGRITGKLLEKTPPALLSSTRTASATSSRRRCRPSTACPRRAKRCRCTCTWCVREDAQLLYGFGSKLERSLFRELLKVSGVGAKVALSILSGMSADDFSATVGSGDAAALVRIPGIGKKTAERLVVEMRDRGRGARADGAAGRRAGGASRRGDTGLAGDGGARGARLQAGRGEEARGRGDQGGRRGGGSRAWRRRSGRHSGARFADPARPRSRPVRVPGPPGVR